MGVTRSMWTTPASAAARHIHRHSLTTPLAGRAQLIAPRSRRRRTDPPCGLPLLSAAAWRPRRPRPRRPPARSGTAMHAVPCYVAPWQVNQRCRSACCRSLPRKPSGQETLHPLLSLGPVKRSVRSPCSSARLERHFADHYSTWWRVAFSLSAHPSGRPLHPNPYLCQHSPTSHAAKSWGSAPAQRRPRRMCPPR